MILLLGASGCIGRTFASELRRRGRSFIPLTLRAFDYTRFDFLFDYVRTMNPEFLVNAASYGGPADRQPTKDEREKMLAANAILPQMIARVCLMTKTPWGHVSSGSIYCGAKVFKGGKPEIQRDLGRADMLELFERHPERFAGFTELDEPNFSLRSPPCSFHSVTRVLAEEAVRDIGRTYVWRLRLPFSDRQEPCNWLWRLYRQTAVADTINSFSHLEDCVRACLDLFERRAPFGLYNVTNPGAMTAGRVAGEMRRLLGAAPRVLVRPAPEPGREPQSNCILDSSKLLRAGVRLRPLAEAMDDCLERLRRAAQGAKTTAAARELPPGSSQASRRMDKPRP